jgi:hypothetical protein
VRREKNLHGIVSVGKGLHGIISWLPVHVNLFHVLFSKLRSHRLFLRRDIVLGTLNSLLLPIVDDYRSLTGEPRAAWRLTDVQCAAAFMNDPH